jgi:hypothetical protein
VACAREVPVVRRDFVVHFACERCGVAQCAIMDTPRTMISTDDSPGGIDRALDLRRTYRQGNDTSCPLNVSDPIVACTRNLVKAKRASDSRTLKLAVRRSGC